MNKELNRQLKFLEKAEAKFLNKPENKLMRDRIDPLTDKLQQKIPVKVSAALEVAFAQSFRLIFEKGEGLIERTFQKDRKQLEHELMDFALDKAQNRRYFHRMDQPADRSKLFNTSLSAVEGGVLGFLGIGLPDIPLFIAVVLRNLYEIALSYGFDYRTEAEKFYLLDLIRSALATGEEGRRLSERLDLLGGHIDAGSALKLDTTRQLEQTARQLAQAMLVAKFIQGIPVVGTVGGIVNYRILRRISQYAGIKYKKRYLLKKAGTQDAPGKDRLGS